MRNVAADSSVENARSALRRRLEKALLLLGAFLSARPQCRARVHSTRETGRMQPIQHHFVSTLLELSYQLPHPSLGCLVRQAPEGGLDVLLHVFRAGRLGHDGGDGGMGENVFQRELRPGGAVEFGGPFGQLSLADQPEVVLPFMNGLLIKTAMPRS